MEKRLYRSRRDKMISGVCGGLGEYFKIDPVLIRLIFVILAFINAIGIIAYILLWIIVPPEGKGGRPSEVVRENIEEIKEEAEKITKGVKVEVESEDRRNRIFFGFIIIIIGLLLLLANFNVIYWSAIGKLWPLFLVLLGFYLIATK
jgi:phage shock protein PspC (stress-responsive transcriptional regulator)